MRSRCWKKCDPIKVLERALDRTKASSPTEDFEKLDSEIKERVRKEYADAEKAEDPSPNELELNVRGAVAGTRR